MAQNPNSDVDICNLALDYLNQDGIQSITPAEGRAAQTISRWYHQVRRSTLRAHPWNFASKRVTLTADATAPVFEFTHAYNLPNDFVRYIGRYTSLGDFLPPSTYNYEIENGQILMNGDDDDTTIYVRYVFDQKIVTKFDPLFIDLFALNLAIRVARKFGATEAKIKTLIELQQEALTLATAIDGQERPPRRVQQSKFARSRRGGGVGGGIAGKYTVFEGG